MKVKETEDYIMILREAGDSEDSFKEAFDTGIVTLMVGKETKRANLGLAWGEVTHGQGVQRIMKV